MEVFARFALFILVAGCALCARSHRLQAQPQASSNEAAQMRVVVRICSARDAQALTRLRGQTSDLPVLLIPREGDELEHTLRRQLERSGALARELHADAVIWFDSTGQQGADSVLVYVATPGSGRVLAHELEAPSEPADRGPNASGSGLLEQSALVVRFALQGLSQGGSIGIEQSAALAQVEPPAAVSAPPPPASPDAPAASTDQPHGPLWLALGYELAIDGFAPSGHHGLGARAATSIDELEFSLSVSAGLPARRDLALSSMSMQRVRGAVGLSWLLPLGGGFSAAFGACAGVLLQHRETRDPAPEVAPRPARWNGALSLGPEARVQLRRGRFGVLLGLALDLLPSPTRFVYREGLTQRRPTQPWRAQPRLSLSLEVAP